VPGDVPPPTVEIGWVCIACNDPGPLAAWWQELIGGNLSVDDDGDVHLDGGPVPLLFLGVPEEKRLKNRLHFDLRVEDFEAALRKAVALGARPADDIFLGERWRVFRDPEGNVLHHPPEEPSRMSSRLKRPDDRGSPQSAGGGIQDGKGLFVEDHVSRGEVLLQVLERRGPGDEEHQRCLGE
jgi:hypothetical protein